MDIYKYEVIVNGKVWYSLKEGLLTVFSCENLSDFETIFLKSLKMNINKAGEIADNHILKIESESDERDMSYYLSPTALRTLALIASNMQINQEFTFKIYCDIDKRWNWGILDCTPNRPLQVGETVEILTTTPDKLYPATAMINYCGKVGRIIDSEPEGYFHVVISSNIPAAAFRAASLKRKSKQ